MMDNETRRTFETLVTEWDFGTLESVFQAANEGFEKLAKKRLINPTDQKTRRLHNEYSDMLSIMWTEIRIRQEAGLDYILNYEEVA